MENFLFITLNIIIGVGLHVLFTVMRAFQVRLIAFILVILILIIAEHLITVNYLNNQRRVCRKLIEVEYLDHSLFNLLNCYLL